MKELGFKGKILASPLLRTMETAELVAEENGLDIIPAPWFMRYLGTRMRLTFRGLHFVPLQDKFDKAAKLAPNHYWLRTEYTQQQQGMS